MIPLQNSSNVDSELGVLTEETGEVDHKSP